MTIVEALGINHGSLSAESTPTGQSVTTANQNNEAAEQLWRSRLSTIRYEIVEHNTDSPVLEESAERSRTRFQILRPYARGGRGEVFIARDTELNRNVALKEIQRRYASDSETRDRFRREAEITGQLEHPGVVPVYGLGAHEDGRPYYAMRLIQGDNLKRAIQDYHRSPIPPSEKMLSFRNLLKRFVDVCNAMDYAHSRGVIHRDLKPENVMIGHFGETLVVDWGLARIIGQANHSASSNLSAVPEPIQSNDSAKTMDGTIMGTPPYMSPEQALGNGELDQSTDIYSMGAILHEILTSKPPVRLDVVQDESRDLAGVLR
jgi:serine/threonine protein kinase